jgi:epoxyqueuosine reductase QueG
MPYGISIAKKINPEIIKSIKNSPNNQYYNEYNKLNKFLDDISYNICGTIKKMGYSTIPKKSTEDSADKNYIGTELPHKTVATKSGIGWIGKSALLVTKKYGSAIRLTTVVNANFI